MVNFQSYINKMTIVLSVDENVFPDPYKLCDDIAESLKLVKDAVVKRGLSSNAQNWKNRSFTRNYQALLNINSRISNQLIYIFQIIYHYEVVYWFHLNKVDYYVYDCHETIEMMQ